ncbi:amidohydrolase family protein [Nocardioides mangrovi]|uniref:Amidohydrolase family protein n=1 Tax=Nocardioides mangrovi TaxID=2874580 RepID=A0ABS7UCQ5_9ACTN|nr:amidohydrolase family protein [Nocardioides mangrovi]MBZ5738448.1 amidohydrolase family protein [Nocardioides mangrovi]
MNTDAADLLVRGARLITMAPGADDLGYVESGWLLVADGRIAALGAGDPPADVSAAEVLDVDGAFVAPGFVSTHSHLFTSASRGLGVSETLYGWCDSMLGLLRHAGAEDIYWTTLHGALDFLGNGVTTAYDFTDPRIPWEPMVAGVRQVVGRLRPADYQLRQVDAKTDAGLRFVNSTSLDDAVGTSDEVLGRFAQVCDYVAGLDPDVALGNAVTGGVQWSNRPDAAELEVEAMRRHGALNQAHFLETREAVEVQRSKFALYRDSGALGPRMIFGHFIQTTDEIIAAAAESGSGMSWQPSSNGRLASGTAKVPQMLAAGMTVGMGLDDQACTDVSDPWQNMRAGMFLVRAESGRPLDMMPETVLRLHTLGGAELLGVADRVGSLEVGKLADFVVVDPAAPDVGPLWHPVRSYVLACGLRNLKRVYVGGRLVSREGVSTSPLAAEASRKVREVLGALAREHGWPA